MKDKIKLLIEGKDYYYPVGTRLDDIVSDFYPDYMGQIVLCNYNNTLKELNNYITDDGKLEFLDITSTNGIRTYRRSVIFVLQKALDNIYKDRPHDMRVIYSLGDAYFCKLDNGDEITDLLISKIKNEMESIVKEDIPIRKHFMDRDKARDIFANLGMKNKENLLKYRAYSRTNVYNLDGTMDYFYGFMVPSTGYVKKFDISKLEDGFILQFPTKKNGKMEEFKPPMKLFYALKKSTDWSKMLEISSVGELNELISNGKILDMILMQEALMEAQIGDLASEIAKRKDVKFIMIAGPSSSGKTTFSHKLSVHLRGLGLIPHPVPLDDYYLNRDQMPLDEYGEKDFEALESLDVERFNNDMQSLLSGKETELPLFDFTSGSRKDKGRMLKLGEEDVLVIEGIHGLNDALSYSLPVESKYKVYISPLNMLAIDEHNPLSTADSRLLRRMVRDARTRGADAKTTISMWPSVRRGEIKNIFPFQEGADYMFNTALVYEIAVMKLYAEPLLYAIGRDEEEYAEARRLIRILNYVLPMPTMDIPNNSLVREFIGGSVFKV